MGKASLPKTGINDTLDANRERKKQFGRERSAASGIIGTSLGTSGSGFNTTGNNIIQASTLPTAGGTMIGPIAFYPRLQFLNTGTTTLDISKSTGTAYSSRVIVSGQSNVATISTISGAAHAGQILFLQAASAQTITINETGNISIPGSTTSYIMTANEIILLQYDTTTSKWITITLSTGSSGWVGTATSDLNMASYDINLNGNSIIFDSADINTYIESSGADIIQIFTGGSTRLKVSNTGTLFSSDVTLLSGFADLNIGGSNINFNTGQSILATGAGITHNIPTSDSHYFTVNGVTALQIGATDTTHYNNVKPASSLTYDLGSSSRRYRYIYALQIVDLGTLTMDGTIDMDGNMLNFDADNDTYIESSNDDQMSFFTSDSIRMKITNSNVLFNTDISMITGTRINFSDTGTPSGAGGYFKVKVGGVEKYVPYYS